MVYTRKEILSQLKDSISKLRASGEDLEKALLDVKDPGRLLFEGLGLQTALEYIDILIDRIFERSSADDNLCSCESKHLIDDETEPEQNSYTNPKSPLMEQLLEVAQEIQIVGGDLDDLYLYLEEPEAIQNEIKELNTLKERMRAVLERIGLKLGKEF